MSTLYQGYSSECEDESVKYQAVNDPLAIIYNEGLWRVNKVSPLYNLKYSLVKFKQYAAKIRQNLVRSGEGTNTLKYTVKFEEHSALKYSETDASSLLITVSSGLENNANVKVAYVAILLSWGMGVSIENAINLPYMLERGEQRVGVTVKSTLQTAFDCNIQQFNFTQHQILHCGLKFVENDSSRSNDHFTLIFKTPHTPEKNRLSLSFHVGDIRVICNRIKSEENMTTDLVYLAYQILQNQIFSMCSLDITVLDLCEVNLPKAEIKNTGAIKMKTPEAVNCAFEFLNNISNNNVLKDLSNSE